MAIGSEYKHNLIEFIGPTEPTGPNIVPGDLWNNTKDNVICKRETNGYWNCGYINAGFILGGASSYSVIDRFNFPFDSGVANSVGNLSNGINLSSTPNSSQYGYIMGGFTSAPVSFIQRITFLNLVTCTVLGNLNVSMSTCCANFNSSLHGFTAGGNYPVGTNSASYVNRLTFSSDSSNTTVLTNLQVSSHIWGGVNSSLHGYIWEGFTSGTNISSCERLTFPYDSGPTLLIASTSRAYARQNGCCNSSLHGYVLGGWNGSSYYSTISRCSFPYSSGATAAVGALSTTRMGVCSNNSTSHGYCLHYAGSASTSIDRFSFPFDSGTSITIGTAASSAILRMAIDGTDFVQQFV